MARLSADFTNTLNLKDAEGEAIQPKEIWAALEVGGAEIGDRSKVSDGTMVQLLLASDASIATYLTLAYTGDENPITTIYKDLPISSLSSDGSVSSLSNYFRGITTAASEGLIEPNATIGNIGDDGIFGTVGIGTASPETKLHIRNGDVLLSNGQSYFIKNTTGTNVKVMGLSPSNNITIGNTSVNDMNLYGGSGRLRFHTSAVSPFMTALNNGNVGINTASPETKLHIRNGDVLLSNGQSYFIENTTGTNVKVMGLSPSNNITIGNTSVNDMNLYGGSGNLRFHTSAVSPFMAALNNGNVGIGTTNPGAYKLAVDGTIGCRE
ncbi:MAG: hypothetical protein U5R49_06750 [Deltaproteobacteria bacterium]|nr:hypothetical protein [Deltaproteobacteria bacterium]